MCRKTLKDIEFKHTPPPPPKQGEIKTVRCTCGHRLFDHEGAIHNLQIKCPKCKKVNFVNR